MFVLVVSWTSKGFKPVCMRACVRVVHMGSAVVSLAAAH